ncbi:MAG: translation initiation factor eIF-1A [Candidatus Micrarchaeota archaeon]
MKKRKGSGGKKKRTGYRSTNKKKKTTKSSGPIDMVGRVRTPRQGEILGTVLGLMGASRLLVACKDEKERLCRIPGKIKRRIWVREGDVVILKPWIIEGDKKADIIWRYTRIQSDWLKKKGYYDD